MQSCSCTRQRFHGQLKKYLPQRQIAQRSKSTLSAIRHGIRRSANEFSQPEYSIRRDGRDTFAAQAGIRALRPSASKITAHDADTTNKAEGRSRSKERLPTLASRTSRPLKTLEYSTPASEFIYGTSTVLAALKAGRRKCYKLYLAERDTERPDSRATLEKFARLRGAELVVIRDGQVGALDKASKGRPHNGLILEASPLPKLPVQALLQVARPQPSFSVVLAPQSQEEKLVNGGSSEIVAESSEERYPLVVMLDGIQDPGNLGAVLRSAFFLGVDAVVLSTHNTELGPVALKASAGASESLQMLSVHSTGAFVQASRNEGWSVYAAVAPPTSEPKYKFNLPHLYTTDLKRPLEKSPVLLMLGEEGSGLKPDLVKKASHLISIGGQRSGRGGVDSLNVSVAAALLFEAFFRRPSEQVPGAVNPQESDLF